MDQQNCYTKSESKQCLSQRGLSCWSRLVYSGLVLRTSISHILHQPKKFFLINLVDKGKHKGRPGRAYQHAIFPIHSSQWQLPGWYSTFLHAAIIAQGILCSGDCLKSTWQQNYTSLSSHEQISKHIFLQGPAPAEQLPLRGMVKLKDCCSPQVLK